jgi:uncharacterized protein (TIGR02118 family)
MERNKTMNKLIAFFKRKPGMSILDFHTYWRTTHAELVIKIPGLRRYAQSHTLLSGYDKNEPIYDGVGEGWYDNFQIMRALANAPEYSAVRADEANFIDLSTMGWLITDEYVIKDGPIPESGVKNIAFITRKPGMPVEEFQRYWREIHAPVAASIPMVRRYVQSHVRRGIYDSGRTPIYDGVAITWFDGTREMRQTAATREYEVLRADESNFMNPAKALEKLPFIITKEHLIMP